MNAIEIISTASYSDNTVGKHNTGIVTLKCFDRIQLARLFYIVVLWKAIPLEIRVLHPYFTEDGEILLSPRANTAIEDNFSGESTGEVNLKGISAPVEVFRLLERSF